MRPRIRRLPPGRMFRQLTRYYLSCLLLSLVGILPAYAADAGARRVFNVPAGPAEQSLKLFSEQSGRGVIFSTDSLKDARTKAVQGEFTPREAIDRMIEGTALVLTQDEKTGAFGIKRDSGPNAERAAQSDDRPGNGAKPEPGTVGRDPNVDTVTLSPFTVTADADVGYAASSTLAGSRFNTPLKDTAASISVLTAEFISDIGATNLTEALQYSTSTQPDQDDAGSDGANPSGNSMLEFGDRFRVRGQNVTQARNYFALRIQSDNYNVERIEDSRGPNSVLFGFGSPGGIVNVSTKQARLDRSFKRATVQMGSFDSHRETLDVNQLLLHGRLGLRLNAVYDQSNDFREYAFSRDRRFDLAVKFQATPATQFRAVYE
ncbi:MAG: TonB-dependent receptor plug domain-containing protein, partial [Opitutaceae bacterium]